MAYIDDLGASVRRFLESGAIGRLVTNVSDDALNLGRAIVRGATTASPLGRAPTNMWTGLMVKPWVSWATFGAGMAIGVARGIANIEQVSATGAVSPPVAPPNLLYDYTPNGVRSTPPSAESLGAGGDLVFALNDAYMR